MLFKVSHKIEKRKKKTLPNSFSEVSFVLISKTEQGHMTHSKLYPIVSGVHRHKNF